LTPYQEFREARDWLAQHKRDPFLWLIILMTLTSFTLNFGSNVILWSAFPSSDAERIIGQVLDRADVRIINTKMLCKLPRGSYVFGYDFGAVTATGGEKLGRICRDIVNGRWVFSFDDPKFNLESR